MAALPHPEKRPTEGGWQQLTKDLKDHAIMNVFGTIRHGHDFIIL